MTFKKKPIKIGHLSTFYHTAALFLSDPSLMKCLGEQFEWRLFGTGPAIVEAFSRNEIDIAYIGLPPAIIGMARGIRIKCIAGGHIEGTVLCGHSRFPGYPEHTDLGKLLAQFSGMTIGVPGKGSIHDVILSDALDRSGLAGKITVRNFRWADEITEAMKKQQVAAAFGTPALAVAVTRYAAGKLLFPAERIWPDNPSYGIVARDEIITDSADSVRAFLRAHEEAANRFRNEPEAVAGVIAGYIGVVDRDFVIDTIRISPKYCAALTSGYIASTMEFVKTMKRLGYIDRETGEESIFDLSLIREVHPDKDHYQAGIRA